MGVLNLPQVHLSEGGAGGAGSAASALMHLLGMVAQEKMKNAQAEEERQRAGTSLANVLGIPEKTQPPEDTTIPETIRRPVDQLEPILNPKYKALQEQPKEVSTAVLKNILAPNKGYSGRVVMPSKDSETKWGHFAVEGNTNRYIGPAPIPYGSTDQPGMSQYVGPSEDDPTKGNIFVPTRGGGEIKTISSPGRISKRTLDSMPANSKTSLASARVAYKGIMEAEQIYNEALKGVTGPIEGRAQLAYSKIANSPNIAQLQQKLGRTLAAILRAESGLVVTDTERKFYEDQLLPMLKNPQANFEVLLRETKKWIEDIHDSNVDILRESNTESPNKLSESFGKQTKRATSNQGDSQIAPAGTKARLKDGRMVTSDGKGGWN